MKQRALVAMGVAAMPKLIIADEPTKGMDAVKKSRVVELFEKIEGCSLLVITTICLLPAVLRTELL